MKITVSDLECTSNSMRGFNRVCEYEDKLCTKTTTSIINVNNSYVMFCDCFAPRALMYDLAQHLKRLSLITPNKYHRDVVMNILMLIGGDVFKRI
jgi:hypothetical protein